jgi:hypothetical protein
MNCQEVMDYMQRELDGDLSVFESVKAHEHIRQCADCAAMYERLKRLSAELENLPKVTPPISLVDAILPKLDEIDRVNAASADAGATDLPGSAGTTARTSPRRRNSRFSLRILSGVVAAGVVAGVFLVMNDPDRPRDSISGNFAATESSSSGSSGPMLMMDASTDASGAQKRFGAAMPADIAEAPAQGTGADSSADSLKQPARVPSGDGLTDSGASPGSGSGTGSTEGENVMSPPAVLDGAGDRIGVAEPGERTEDDVQLVITGFVDQYGDELVESVSPDGSYTAVFADSRVVIYDRDGNARFEGEARQGSIAAMGWSEDGTYFRYEIRLEDGTEEIYRIDPAAGTETKE